MSMDSMSNLQRREIQAEFFATLIREFISEFGYERAMQAATAAIQKDAFLAGKNLAEKYGGNSLPDLLRLIREVWAEDNALEFTLLEQTGQELCFNVTRCKYAELYERQGVKEYGYCLSCNRDAALIAGFNPHMRLVRTQTIMQGADFCDFRIELD
jgi:hypothetical protein